MTSIIKGFFIVMLLALPSLANATFLKSHHHGIASEDRLGFGWHQSNREDASVHPLVDHEFNHKLPIFGREDWQNHDNARLSKLIMGFFAFLKFHDFGSFDHKYEWKKCETSEVPLPAALPLFSLALFSLGLAKRQKRS